MSSKREEERNEKIIRGLMKLPPNRRCINCNSLGPQYVCINFWTFVCMTCSGIHREFTHRVKSVSMSKFTSQEVEALQNGGNQRAKEIFLKDWDFQRQRQPSGSNIERIREFIKHVYVDKKYAGGKSSEKPPRDTQGHLKTEAETRRASSYHSYSQSPPYDFQYEERWNKKQGIMLTRKPGSDRGLYEGKGSGLYSPGRYSDHVSQERFGIEGSSSRASDYSMSSDPFRSHPQSPNSLKGSGFNSPTFEHSKDGRVDDIQYQTRITQPETHSGRDGVAAPSALGTVSSAPSEHGTAASLNPLNSTSFFDAFPEPDQPSAVHQNKPASVSSIPQSFVPANNNSVELFKEPHGRHPVNLASSTDLFQSPAVQPLADLFHASDSSASSGAMGSSHASPLFSLSFFEDNSQNSSGANIGAAPPKTAPNDVGWATFDLPQHPSTSKSHDSAAANPAIEHSGSGSSVGKFIPLSSPHANTQWPDFPGSSAHGAPPLMSSSQHGNLHADQSLAIASNSQEWRPFDDIDNQQGRDGQVLSDKPSSVDHFMGTVESENLNKGISQDAAAFGPVPGSALHVHEESTSIDHSGFALMGELHSQFEHNPSNPFDIPYEADLDASNSFYDMSSLQDTLPSTDFSTSLTGGMNDSWFLQDATNPCITAPPPGGMSYTAAQVPSSQIANVQAHGPVASVGGNPFA